MKIYHEENKNNEEKEKIHKLSLADRDLYLNQIQAQIDAKKKLLLEKQKMLKNETKHNEFLEVVKDDYKRYYQYVIQQKQEQVKAMDILKQYVNDIIISGKMTDEDIKNAKKEQYSILKELETIKTDLDNLVRETQIVPMQN